MLRRRRWVETVIVCRYPNIPYPAFPAYRERISTEVQQKLTDLARHPAIVLWFGGNEDQCSHYNPARHDGIAASVAGIFIRPDDHKAGMRASLAIERGDLRLILVIVRCRVACLNVAKGLRSFGVSFSCFRSL